MGALKIRQRLLVDELAGGGSLLSPGPSRLVPQAGVLISRSAVPLRRERIELAGVSITVAAAQDFGGLQLADFPAAAAGRFYVLSSRLSGTITVSAGLDAALAAGTIDLGAGTAPASNTTLATTMIDLAPKVDVPASGIFLGLGGLTPLSPAAGADVWINASAACAVDSSITFAAGSFLDLVFVDVGE